MKKLVFLLLLLSTPSFAGEKFFVCLYKDTGERFNIVTINGQDKIQWEGGDFDSVISRFDGKIMTITQIARFGTFKMALDVTKGEGVAVLERFSGEKMAGEILCAVTE